MTTANETTFPRRINIGCGYDKREDYLNVDVDPACGPDLLLRDHDLSALPQAYFEEVRAWDVLEHIPHAFTMSALLDWSSLLVRGGTLTLQTSYVFGVIDMMRMKPSFESDYNWMRCLFGNQAHPGDFHHIGFTDRTLRTFLFTAGFGVTGFSVVDNWLIQCSVKKVRDWSSLLSLGDAESVAKAYTEYLRRDIDDKTSDFYLEEMRAGKRKRDVVKEIIGSHESVYKLGARLDADPSLAGREAL